jgi:hypothetical protein
LFLNAKTLVGCSRWLTEAEMATAAVTKSVHKMLALNAQHPPSMAGDGRPKVGCSWFCLIYFFQLKQLTR